MSGSPAGVPALRFNHNTTFGALLGGFGVSSLLLGVLSTQAYAYYKRYPEDRSLYKVLVIILWLVETADEALVAHAAYTYMVTKWGDPTILFQRPVISLALVIGLGVLTGTIVKINFAMRVWRFSKKNVPVTGLIILMTLAELGTAILYCVRGLQLDSLSHVSQLKTVGTLALGVGVATDVLIAGSLCFFLRGLKTGYKRDDNAVVSLMIYAINTGIITSVVSLSTLLLYNFMPENFIFMAFYWVLSKLYANSFMAALNSRRITRGRGTENSNTTVPTFLMVGKLTQHTQHRDPESFVPSPLSAYSAKSDRPWSSVESPQTPPATYYEAW